MKVVARELGIKDNITTYTARHSYATTLKRSRANIAYISESLGHNDLSTTEHYLASFEREERKELNECIGSIANNTIQDCILMLCNSRYDIPRWS